MLRGRKLLFYILSKAVFVNGVSWPLATWPVQNDISSQTRFLMRGIKHVNDILRFKTRNSLESFPSHFSSSSHLRLQATLFIYSTLNCFFAPLSWMSEGNCCQLFLPPGPPLIAAELCASSASECEQSYI